MTTASVGTCSLCRGRPLNASTSVNSMGEVAPKLASTDSLLHTVT